MRKIFVPLAALSLAAVCPATSFAQGGPEARPKVEVIRPVKSDVSPPLATLTPQEGRSNLPPERPLRYNPSGERHGRFRPDPVVQGGGGQGAGPLVATTGGLNILGLGQNFTGPQGTFSVQVAPPDPTGAAGATQYVQMVNPGSFAIFDKATGAVVYGPAGFNTLFSGFGGPCEAFNDGDPIVQYDKAANRWLLTQFAISQGSPYFQCVAVSQTSDATGAYNRYAYTFTDLNDYPKVGVWPDGYYVSFNMFAGGFFVGARACAMDRKRMLAGQPASIQCFQLSSSVASLLPSDQDGASVPPVGSPNHFINFGPNSLRIWRFHADFANPANTTFTGPTTIAVAPFTPACNGFTRGQCIPQSGTQQRLESLGDRLMFRAAYRNFGYQQPEALVVNHSIATASGGSAVRWYELRNLSGTPTVFQQGTYAPDSNSRWMGSIAMDRAGNIAVGYSVSSSFIFPGIRYTGRTPGDPPGTLQAENTVINGGGAQVGLARWGDYSHMSIDPTDDCTMWYTNEYLPFTGSFNWSTRINSFKFPTCSGGNPIDDTPFYVRQQYVDVLRREPDPGGFNGWSSFINGCSPSDAACIQQRRITTARGFLESIEFRDIILCQRDGVCALRDNPPDTAAYNAEYVRQLYLVYLQREPDAGGYNAWLNYINTHPGDYDTLVHGFIYSSEYRRRFGA